MAHYGIVFIHPQHKQVAACNALGFMTGKGCFEFVSSFEVYVCGDGGDGGGGNDTF